MAEEKKGWLDTFQGWMKLAFGSKTLTEKAKEYETSQDKIFSVIRAEVESSIGKRSGIFDFVVKKDGVDGFSAKMTDLVYAEFSLFNLDVWAAGWQVLRTQGLAAFSGGFGAFRERVGRTYFENQPMNVATRLYDRVLTEITKDYNQETAKPAADAMFRGVLKESKKFTDAQIEAQLAKLRAERGGAQPASPGLGSPVTYDVTQRPDYALVHKTLNQQTPDIKELNTYLNTPASFPRDLVSERVEQERVELTWKEKFILLRAALNEKGKPNDFADRIRSKVNDAIALDNSELMQKEKNGLRKSLEAGQVTLDTGSGYFYPSELLAQSLQGNKSPKLDEIKNQHGLVQIGNADERAGVYLLHTLNELQDQKDPAVRVTRAELDQMIRAGQIDQKTQALLRAAEPESNRFQTRAEYAATVRTYGPTAKHHIQEMMMKLGYSREAAENKLRETAEGYQRHWYKPRSLVAWVYSWEDNDSITSIPRLSGEALFEAGARGVLESRNQKPSLKEGASPSRSPLVDADNQALRDYFSFAELKENPVFLKAIQENPEAFGGTREKFGNFDFNKLSLVSPSPVGRSLTADQIQLLTSPPYGLDFKKFVVPAAILEKIKNPTIAEVREIAHSGSTGPMVIAYAQKFNISPEATIKKLETAITKAKSGENNLNEAKATVPEIGFPTAEQIKLGEAWAKQRIPACKLTRGEHTPFTPAPLDVRNMYGNPKSHERHNGQLGDIPLPTIPDLREKAGEACGVAGNS